MWKDFPTNTGERLELLKNLRVVLVRPKFPGNLGMTARAMKNCALHDLRLVSPRAELNKEAYQLAPSAGDVLDTSRIHDTLAEAVADCGLVIGTTKRRGVMRRNVMGPEEAASMIGSVLNVNRAALVFGSEDTGLDNDDLALCHWIVGLHTGGNAESFNLSHSVAIVCYLVNRAVAGAEAGTRKLAATHDLEHMFADLTRLLLEIGFIHELDPKRMMVIIRKLLHRSGLSTREVKIIRGMLRQARWRIENPDAPLMPIDTPQNLKKKMGDRKKDDGGRK